MTAEQISKVNETRSPEFWLQEIALQLAALNEAMRWVTDNTNLGEAHFGRIRMSK